MQPAGFAVIGGDRRQTALAGLLQKQGIEVDTWGVPALADTATLARSLEAAAVLLPVPLSRGQERLTMEGGEGPTLAELFALCRPSSRLFAGSISPSAAALAAEMGLQLTDYLEDEALAIRNGALTAEGAVACALTCGGCGLLGADCLVLGFGRIGKLLTLRLQAMGAQVSVAARRRDSLAWAESLGARALSLAELARWAGEFSYCFNTAPAPVMSREVLCGLPQGCVLLDLASTPGFDHQAAGELGHPVFWERGLPGRMFPRAAAAAIWETVLHAIE